MMTTSIALTTDVYAELLVARLAEFGFIVPATALACWDEETIQAIEQVVARWELVYEQAILCLPTLSIHRAGIPTEVAAYEAITATCGLRARDQGRAAARNGSTNDCNPYPLHTALSGIWHAAYEATLILESPELTAPIS